MFTRVVEVKSKPGKSKELTNTVNEKVLSTLKKQHGFVDEIVLTSDKETDRVLAISFWNTREDAERYHREQFANIQESIRHLLEGEPLVRTFNVETYLGQKISAQKAA
jgi:heme-degrading monooxygenase HmoA